MPETPDFAWYSLHWFFPEVINSFQFLHPAWLYGIAALPLLFVLRMLLLKRFGKHLTLALTAKEWASSKSRSWIRLVHRLMLMLALALLFFSMARPQRTSEKVEQWTEGIDIMLAIDISHSMQIEDFTPNRLEAAKKVAIHFIEGRLQDRIGIVVFSGEAYSLAPLTTDYDLLRGYIKSMDFSLIDVRGTAIGSALGVVLNRMQESAAKSKICILLSDGDSNAGNIDPLTAAGLAAEMGVKVYTIIVGRKGRVPFGKDFFGRPQFLENTVDETTMQQIASITGGRFYRATNNRTLEEVFDEIDRLEKSEIKESRYLNIADYYPIYLRWALVFYLLWLLGKSTFLNNLLND